MARLRPIIILMIGLGLLGVASVLPVVDGRVNSTTESMQGWEAAEISFRFLIGDFPRLPQTQLLDPAAGLSLLGLGGPRLPIITSSPMDGVMVSSGILRAGGFDEPKAISRVFLYWVAWSWVANLGVLIGLMVLLCSQRVVRSFRLIFKLAAWFSVLLAITGAVIVLGWGDEPLLFGPAYWAWLLSLIVLAIGGSMRARISVPVPAEAGVLQ